MRLAPLRRIKFRQLEADGTLTEFAAGPRGVAFDIKRVFTIAAVSTGGVRGNHAHRRCTQLLACVSGRSVVHISDGTHSVTEVLVPDGTGLLIPPLYWNTVCFPEQQTTICVFCDELYDESDYIRHWADYLAVRKLSGSDQPPTSGPV